MKAVLVEGVSVVVRVEAIKATLRGGMSAFAANAPTPSNLCADGELARVGFMTPDDARAYVESLERGGLRYLENGKAIDILWSISARAFVRCAMGGVRTRPIGLRRRDPFLALTEKSQGCPGKYRGFCCGARFASAGSNIPCRRDPGRRCAD